MFGWITHISIITFLNIAFDTRAASLLASRDLEAVLHETEAKTHEAEAKTHKAEARFFGLEAETRPRGLTSLEPHVSKHHPFLCKHSPSYSYSSPRVFHHSITYSDIRRQGRQCLGAPKYREPRVHKEGDGKFA